jgi:hypothetical protein
MCRSVTEHEMVDDNNRQPPARRALRSTGLRLPGLGEVLNT